MRKCAILWVIWVVSACSVDTDIVIGFAASLSGSDYLLGCEGRNAAELFVHGVNDSGGILGRKLALEIRDYASDNSALPAVIRELAELGVVCVVGAYTSAAVEKALPVVNELGLVLVSPAATAGSLSGKDDGFFRTVMSSAVDPLVLREYMKETGIERILVLAAGSNFAYAETYIDPLRGNIAEVVMFDSPESIDYEVVTRRFSGENPCAGILVIASSLDTGSIAQDLVARGIKVPLFVSGWAGNEDLVTYGGRAVEGALFVHQVDMGHPSLSSFISSYREKFGARPGFSAVETWDAMEFVKIVLETSLRNSTSILDAIRSISFFQSITGRIEIDRFGDARRPMYLMEVRNGALEARRTVEW